MSKTCVKCCCVVTVVAAVFVVAVLSDLQEIRTNDTVRFSKVRHLISEPTSSPRRRVFFDWTTNSSSSSGLAVVGDRRIDPKVRLESMKQTAKERRRNPRKKKDRSRSKNVDKKRKRNRERNRKGGGVLDDSRRIDSIAAGYFHGKDRHANVSRGVLFDWSVDGSTESLKYPKRIDGGGASGTGNEVFRYNDKKFPIEFESEGKNNKESFEDNSLLSVVPDVSNKNTRLEDVGGPRWAQQNRLPPLTDVESGVVDNSISDPITKQLDFIETQLRQLENVTLVPGGDAASRSADRSSCSINRGGCEHICIQNGTRAKCLCYKGFRLDDATASRCFDVDECAVEASTCSDGCRNVPGSFHCTCPSGFRLSSYDRRTCLDINECLLRNGHGPCEDACTNTRGSYACTCRGAGARLADDGRSCVRGEGACSKCSHTCVRAVARGVAFCTCPVGMYLGPDYRTCEDINECEIPETASTCEHGCVNTPGSFRCEAQSQKQLVARPQRLDAPDHVVCPPLFPPQHGYLDCRRDNVTSYGRRTIHGRYRFRNRPGTTCTLVCPKEQYRQDGTMVRVCGSDGKWIDTERGRCIPHPRPRIRCPSKVHRTVRVVEKRRPVRGGGGVGDVDSRTPAKVLVALPEPSVAPPLDFDRDVVSHPVDAKRPLVALEPGTHWIRYTVTHPVSKRNATCTTIVRVDRHGPHPD